MKRYKWNIIGLSEIRKKGTNEIQTNDGYILHYIGNENWHINGVGFLINNENVKMIMNFNPINERVSIIRLHATPFNVAIIQVYAPTTVHSDEEIEHFNNILQSTISAIDKRDIIAIQGDWNAQIGKDSSLYWENVSGKYCNENTNERGQRLLEFMKINSLIATNTFGPHTKSRINTWHSPGGLHHNQIDYILMQKRCTTSRDVNDAQI